MSNMKDYMMWLDNKGIATWDNAIGDLIVPEGTIIWTYELKDQYDNDAKWHGVEDDDNEMPYDEDEDEDDDGLLSDDELGDNNELLVNCSWTPEEHWISPDGGITADASLYLHELDSKGELI